MEINSMENETIRYEQNENEYIINLSFNSSEIKFNIQKGKQYQYTQFETNFTFAELKNISLFFAQFPNVEKIGNLFINLLNNKKITIAESQNLICLSFMNITEEKISISIKQKEFSANELINKLAHTVENLINDIQELKKENKELIQFKIKMEEKEKRKYGIENSSIIKNEEQIKMISDWIAPNQKIIFTRIYRATKDGGIGYNFHKHCDNQGPTLTLIESTKGYIFGGYITISWESPTSGTYKGNDDNAFIFSVNNKLKYPIQDKSKVIYNYYNY